MFSPQKRLIALLTLVLWGSQMVAPIVTTTYATNTTYYVDATAGSDANDGSSWAPWQTLAGVSTHTFTDWDQILLKCGETWTDSLVLGSGAATNTTIGSYGTCNQASIPTLAGTGWLASIVITGNQGITIQWLKFTGWTGVTLNGASQTTISKNIFQNKVGSSVATSDTQNTTVSFNFFNLPQTAIGLGLKNQAIAYVNNNTFSGGIVSVGLLNTRDTTLTDNTFYKPSMYAVAVVEDTTVAPGTVFWNSLEYNTILTYNPSYPMVHVEDQNDANGILLMASSNQFVNVYKTNQTLVEVLRFGSATQNYDKNNITTFDSAGKIFWYFGYTSHNGDETLLLVNTGATMVSLASPPGWYSSRSVDINNTKIAAWPVDVSAYGAKILLWDNSPNIVRIPTISFNTSVGSINNGESVVLSWVVTNSLSNTLDQPTATGWVITSSIANIGSGTYYPPMNNTHNIYTITATNSIGSSTATVDITTQNSPPLVSAFFMTGSEDASSITGVLQATESSGDTVNFEKFTDPSHGTLAIYQLSGNAVYTPESNWCGTDTFTWRAFDQYVPPAYSDETQGTITVLCTNDAPVAIDDTLHGTGGKLVSLDVTANDTDVDTPYQPQTFTVSAVTMPTHGTLVASGAIFDYTPDALYMGSDSFTYTITDQSGATSNIGTVTLSVAPGYNIAPVVSPGSIVGDEDTGIGGTFSGSDLNGDPLTYSATTPSHGTVTISGNTFTYTPTSDYNGTDTFDVTANDGTASSTPAKISVTINPVADTPVAHDDSINMEMDTTATIDVLANDTDADNPYQPQTLTITGIVTPPSSGTASIVGNKIQYTPGGTHFLGSDSLTYQIVDQDGHISNTATVNISVTTTNQVPLAESMTFSGTEDIPLANTLSGSDPDWASVSFILDQNVSHGTLVLSATGGFVYTPNLNFNGTDTFTYHVSDGIFQSSLQTVTLAIDAVNDWPTANADTSSTIEDTPVVISPTLNDTDPEGDTISLHSITQPLHGTTTQSWNTVTYSPSTNFCGSDSFQYIAQDQYGVQSAGANVSITISCVNDAPVVNDASYSMTGNILSNSGNTLLRGLPTTDMDGDVLSYILGQNVSHGTLNLSGTTFSYTPNLDFAGTDTFTFVASDGLLSSNTGTITISVAANTFNTAPVAVGGSYSTNEDTTLAGTLSGSDAEGNTIMYVLDQNVSHGTLSIGVNGSFTYTPSANYHGADLFTYHVSDGIAVSPSVTVSLTITSVNDAPIAQDDVVNASENSAITFNPVTNDTDADGDVLILFSTTTPSHGSATSSGNMVTYTPSANWCGTDSMQYSVADPSALLSNTGTVTLSVACVNDAPVTTPDTTTGTEDTSLTIDVLANDTDADRDNLTITNLTQPATGGSVRVSGSSVIFTPTLNFCSTNPITFTYQAKDPSGATSAVTTVTITSLACVNDAPTADAMKFSMVGNVVISSGTVLSGGTLSGYLATNNSLSGMLSGHDVDLGTTLIYTKAGSPSHGTVTVHGSGSFSYTPTVGYFGTDSFTYTVSDGSITSTPATVTITVTDPNPPVTPSTGPGGGSPGSVGGSSSIGYVSTYTEVVSTASGSAKWLTSQLYLGSPVLSGASLSSAPSLAATYQALLEPIKTAVNTAVTEQVSSRKRAVEMRLAGQKLLHSIKKSLILSALEKKNALATSSESLATLKTKKIPEHETRALTFILRLLTRERALIEKWVSTVKSLLSL